MEVLMTVAAVWVALPQILWVWVYARRPWRSTPIGWVFLLKGTTLGAVFAALLVELVLYDIPRAGWATLLFVLGVAVWTYFVATLRADKYWRDD